MNFRSYYLAKELQRQGHTLTVFAGSFSHLFTHPPKVTQTFTPQKVEGVNYIWVKLPSYRASKSVKRLWSMVLFSLKLLFFNPFRLNKPDVIIISSLSLFPILNAYIWSKIFNAKLIFEVRDIWPLSLIELGNVTPSNPLVVVLGWLERFGYKKADYVVSLLPKAKEHMLTKGLAPEKFITIANGIYLDELRHPKPLSTDVIAQLPRDKFIVGYAGTLGIANALEYFIEAAELLQKEANIHFVLVGNGSEKTALINVAQTKQLYNITFIEAIEKTQIQSMLQCFDVCYIGWHHYPLYRFGISANKLFDYMYAKKPIIHSVDAGNDPVVEAACGISVPPENARAIADAIITLYRMSAQERDVLGARAREYVITHHSYEVLAQRYAALF